MTVAFDAATESVRTATTDPYAFNHTGRAEASGGIQAVVVALINYTSATNQVNTVTYGGVTLDKIVEATDTSNETTNTQLWFRGNGLTGGTQSVSVDFTSATGDDFHIVATTFTAAGPTVVVDFDSISENTANPQVTLQTDGRLSLAICALAGGLGNVTDYTLVADMSAVHDNDSGQEIQRVDRQTTASTSDFTIGYTSADDDISFAALTISDDLTVRKYSQAQADIKQTYRAYGQTLAVIDGLRFASDTFTRSVGSGLGTADTGGSWSTTDDSKFSTNGSKAAYSSSTTPDQNAWLPSVSLGSVDAQVKFSINQLSTGFIRPGIIVRRDQSATASAVGQWKAYIRIGATGASSYRFNAGGTEIGNVAGATFSAGVEYYMRFQVHNISADTVAYRFRVWQVGTSEPSTWARDTTYTSSSPDVLAPGTVGINGQSDTSPIIISYDDFKAQTYIPAGFGQAQAEILGFYRKTVQSQAEVYYRYGEKTGTTAFDVLGANNASIGGTITLDRPGAIFNDNNGAFRFQGLPVVPSTRTVDSTQLDRGDGPLSLEFWGKRNVDTGVTEWILSKGTGAYGIYIASTDEGPRLAKVGGGVYVARRAASWPVDSTFHHVVITKNGATSKVYWDGLDVTDAGTDETLTNTNDDLIIGDEQADATYDWDLDEVAIYSIDLNPTQVWEHYTIGKIGSLLRFAQAQAEIGVPVTVIYQHAQAQADIEQTYNVHGQAQATIKTTYYQHGQTQANIKQTYYVHGQAQGTIKQVYFNSAQAQGTIKQVYYVHAQAQGTILQTYYVHAQAQGSIKQTYLAFAQALGTLATTGFGLAQAQASIKQTYYQHGQAQGIIKQTYYAHAQAQGNILQIYYVHGQSQATIEQTYNQHAQTQASIKQTYYIHAQAQAKINAFDVNQHGQAQGTLKQTYNAHAQAQGTVLTTYMQVAQAQGTILQTYYVHGQSQSTVKQTYNQYAQAQGTILQIYYAHAQAQGSIKQVYYAHGQAQARILQVYYAPAQAQGTILATYYVHAQAQGTILQTYYQHAQAQAKINAFGVNQHAQAQALLGIITMAHGQTQAKINAFDVCAHGQAQGTVKQTYYVHAQAQGTLLVTYYVHAQAQGTIEQTYNQHAQAQATIKQIYYQHGQAQGTILTTYYAHGQTQADIKQVYDVHGQTQADILQIYYVHGQAQATILQTYYAHAQAQATILATVNQHGQAQALLGGISVAFGQAQARINAFDISVHGQAQATIEQTYIQHGQAQARILQTYVQHGQAQALIVQTSTGCGQAQGTIKQTYNQYGQAQGTILTTYYAHAQAQADIEQTYVQHGQCQAIIVRTEIAHGQAQSTIKSQINNYAQCQGTILQTYNQCGQTQARILAETRVYGQAQGSIENTYAVHGQCQATIISADTFVHAQAQGTLLQVYNVYGQANAFIQKSAGYGQAQAVIRIDHLLKELYISDRRASGLVISDRLILSDLISDDSKISVLVSDKGGE